MNLCNSKVYSDNRKLIEEGTAAFVIPFWSDGKPHRIEYLKSAIESVYEQTDKNWCIYITDDASSYLPDKSYLAELEQKYKNIKVIFSNINTGPGAARNKAVRSAYSDGCQFICYLDSDDISSKYRVEKVRKVFLDDSEASVVYSTFNVIDEENQPVSKDLLVEGIKIILNDIEISPLEGYDIWINIATERDTLTIPSALNVKTELAYSFPFPEEVRFHEDTHTWLRYSASGAKVRYCPSIPSLYRIPQKSSGSESRDRAGGVEAFNRIRCEIIMKGLNEAISLAQKRDLINNEEGIEVKVRFLLNVASIIKKEGTVNIAKDLIRQSKNISLKYFDMFKPKYDIAELII